MSEFERKYGKYAIKNISLMLILCYAFGYIIKYVNADFLGYLTLNPYKILHGQVWRLFTWIVAPPSTTNIFFVLIMLYFYYSIGTTLERTWGTYRLNVYLFSGMIFTILGAFLLYGYRMIFPSSLYVYMGEEYYYQAVSMMFSTYYVNMSIFLAFAATFPDVQVLLMFLIPIKVKWMGIVYGALLLFEVISGSAEVRFVMIASLMNFAVFFFTQRNRVHLSPKQIKRRMDYRRATGQNVVQFRPKQTGAEPNAKVTKHKCSICGRTEASHPDLQFRFCSKCNGNYEYCEEHIFTHTHKQ